MPRTLQEIIDHADEIAQNFEDYEPSEQDQRPAEPLRHAREAVQARARAEQAVAQSVQEMREARYTWAVIGALLGTSAEAARQRYGVPAKQVANLDVGGLRVTEGIDAGDTHSWTARDDELVLHWLGTEVKSSPTARQQSQRQVRKRVQSETQPGSSPQAHPSAPDRHRAMLEALAELPVRDRTLLELLVSDPPIEYEEIGKLLGMSPSAVRTTRGRLLRKLRAHPSIRAIFADDA